MLGAHLAVGEDNRVGGGATDANRLRETEDLGAAGRGYVYLARHVLSGRAVMSLGMLPAMI